MARLQAHLSFRLPIHMSCLADTTQILLAVSIACWQFLSMCIACSLLAEAPILQLTVNHARELATGCSRWRAWLFVMEWHGWKTSQGFAADLSACSGKKFYNHILVQRYQAMTLLVRRGLHVDSLSYSCMAVCFDDCEENLFQVNWTYIIIILQLCTVHRKYLPPAFAVRRVRPSIHPSISTESLAWWPTFHHIHPFHMYHMTFVALPI